MREDKYENAVEFWDLLSKFLNAFVKLRSAFSGNNAAIKIGRMRSPIMTTPRIRIHGYR